MSENKYSMLNNVEDIEKWLKKCNVTNYSIKDDLTVDIEGSVYINYKDNASFYLTYLPIQFGIVTGDFNIAHNKLETLQGCPHTVGGDFCCVNNRLDSLQYCPTQVGRNFSCSTNFIKTLKYSPEIINGNFFCNKNELINLEYCPRKIMGEAGFSINMIEDLSYLPEEVKGNITFEFKDIILKGFESLYNDSGKLIIQLKDITTILQKIKLEEKLSTKEKSTIKFKI